MRKKLAVLALFIPTLFLSVPTYAQGTYFKGFACNFFNVKCGSPNKEHRWEKAEEPGGGMGSDLEKPVMAAPEIDGSHAGLALALLAGIVAISRERMRRSHASK